MKNADFELTSSLLSLGISLLAIAISVMGFRHGRNRGKVEKAHEMAKAFEELLQDISLLTAIICKHTDIWQLINRVDAAKIQAFNTTELKEHFTDEERQQLADFFTPEKTPLNKKAVRHSFAMARREMNFALPEEAICDDLKKEEYISAETIHMFDELTNDVLNKLEWFSMAFAHNLADSDTVYQSLHQSFLEIVKVLYFRMSFRNENRYDKFYMNTIALFLKWRRQREIAFRSYEKEERKRKEKMKKIENKADKNDRWPIVKI